MLAQTENPSPIQMLIEKGMGLPPLPPNGAVLLQMMRRPADKLDQRKLAELIETDPLLSARLLRVANSPAYGVRRGVARVAQALFTIGMDEAVAIVNFYLLRRMFEKVPELPHFSIEAFWRHSMAVGATARILGNPRYLVAALPGELYTAGLLHDIGKLAMAMHIHSQYAEVLATAHKTGIPLHRAEREVIGVDHAELGGKMLDDWNLPPAILDAVAHHHFPGNCAAEHRDYAGLLEYAHALLAAAGDPPPDDPAPPAFAETWFCRERPGHPLADAAIQQELTGQVAADIKKRQQALEAPAEQPEASAAPVANRPARVVPVQQPPAVPGKGFWGKLAAIFS